jgi:hypothetical protein
MHLGNSDLFSSSQAIIEKFQAIGQLITPDKVLFTVVVLSLETIRKSTQFRCEGVFGLYIEKFNEVVTHATKL